jgi:flagellar basal body-associated protein FliL
MSPSNKNNPIVTKEKEKHSNSTVILYCVAITAMILFSYGFRWGHQVFFVEQSDLSVETTNNSYKYFRLEPGLNLNIPLKSEIKNLSWDVEVVSHSLAVLVPLEHNANLIRNRLISLLNQQPYSNLVAEEFTQEIENQALVLVREFLTAYRHAEDIVQVKLTRINP